MCAPRAALSQGGATKGQGGGMSRAERRGYAALLALVREKLAGLGDTVRLIFRNFDKDHSGTVDYDEFAKGAGRGGSQSVTQSVRCSPHRVVPCPQLWACSTCP